MGVEATPLIGSSAAVFQSFWGQFELEHKRVQTPWDTCAEFGEACITVARGPGLTVIPSSPGLRLTPGPAQANSSVYSTPGARPICGESIAV